MQITGRLQRHPSAPTHPKDDQVDVFAARTHSDALPGFLLAAAQVATGTEWKSKSILSHMKRAFWSRWFAAEQPVTRAVIYLVIPFALADATFRDDVLVVGNLLHRLRVPVRVEEAAKLSNSGIAVEALNEANAATAWLKSYIERKRVR